MPSNTVFVHLLLASYLTIMAGFGFNTSYLAMGFLEASQKLAQVTE